MPNLMQLLCIALLCGVSTASFWFGEGQTGSLRAHRTYAGEDAEPETSEDVVPAATVDVTDPEAGVKVDIPKETGSGAPEETDTSPSEAPVEADLSAAERLALKKKRAQAEKDKEEAKKVHVKDAYIRSADELQDTLDNIRDHLHGLGVLNVSVTNQAEKVRKWSEQLETVMHNAMTRVEDKTKQMYIGKIVVIPTEYPTTAEHRAFQHKLEDEKREMQATMARHSLEIGPMPPEFYAGEYAASN